MSITERISAQLKQAMKDGDKPRLAALRMMRARLQEAEVALRGKKGADYRIDDEQAVEALSRHAKQLRDAVTAYREGGREDRAAAEQAELAVVEQFLPQPLGEAELRQIVAEAVAEADADSPKQMGAVMKLVMARVRGRADGKQVQELVKAALSR